MTTQANAIAGRLRKIREQGQPDSRRRSARRVAGNIYAQADAVYLPTPDSFTASFPDQSVLIAGPAGPTAPRGRAKTDALSRMRQLPPERQHHPAHLSDSKYYDMIQAICQKAVSADS